MTRKRKAVTMDQPRSFHANKVQPNKKYLKNCKPIIGWVLCSRNITQSKKNISNQTIKIFMLCI